MVKIFMAEMEEDDNDEFKRFQKEFQDKIKLWEE